MDLTRTHQQFSKYFFRHYRDTLDWDCDFCGTHAYDNYHIGKNGETIVFCEECFKKVKGE